MTLDGVLTVLGLAAAIYAVVPAVPRLRARLALWIQLPVAVAALGLVLYLEFFDVVARPCVLPWSNICAAVIIPETGGVRPPQAAFLVVLVWMAVAWTLHHLARPGAGALKAIARLSETLIYEQRYAELIAFIEPYLPFVDAAARRKLYLQRLADQCSVWRLRYTEKGRRQAIFDHRPQKPDIGWASWRRVLPIVGWLGVLTPRQNGAQEAAEAVVRILFNSPGLRTYLIEMRPYFGIALLRMQTFTPVDFSDLYLGGLIERPGSALHQELEQTQQTRGPCRYVIPDSARLLQYLFGDIERADRLGAWKPIGDHALAVLRVDPQNAYLGSLRSKPDERFNETCWRDPVFAAFSFFNLMVTEAAHQAHGYNMWLDYVPMIVDRLAQAYDETGPGVDIDDEFPTLAARLIYSAFNMLGEWAKMVRHLPEDSIHRRTAPGLQPDSGHIPKSAAIALGRSLRAVLASNAIGDGFARYMVEVVARDIKALPADGELGWMRELLVRAASSGGAQHRRRLHLLFEQLDPGLRYDVPDLQAVVAAR